MFTGTELVTRVTLKNVVVVVVVVVLNLVLNLISRFIDIGRRILPNNCSARVNHVTILSRWEGANIYSWIILPNMNWIGTLPVTIETQATLMQIQYRTTHQNTRPDAGVSYQGPLHPLTAAGFSIQEQ